MILAINTSTLQFGLAILEAEGNVLAEYLMSKGWGHFGGLMPALHFLFTTSKIEVNDLKGLAVATGPGSFTGLRVGLSAAKGLCHALDMPIMGISSLEALASQLRYSVLPIAPILDSRKGELFTARFMWSNDQGLIRNIGDTSLRLEDFPSVFDKTALFIGNDFSRQGPLLKEILGPRAVLAPPDCWNLKASSIGSLGLKRFLARDFDEPQNLTPVYLRPPDIRPNPYPPQSDKL